MDFVATATTGVKYDPHYWANTAGNVAATQIPLIIALGMKNNVISCTYLGHSWP